ncbi:MAG TPA: hypothetical protein VL688_02880 [Verrucomicrobiae bacterium]|jgi:hypothetical protein|nr:hypothetical protein [Verrucomicrobiae bacterium]
MMKSQPVVQLKLPEIKGNRVCFSWSPNYVFKKNSYWVEYPGIRRITASNGKVAEALFPLCLAFAALGAEIKLPVKIDEGVLEGWRRVISIAAVQNYRRFGFDLTNGPIYPDYQAITGMQSALCFGGGTESLLTLAHLLNHGEKPVLASFGGPAWSGSNPEKNREKFRMDEQVRGDLGLELLKVRSNFREIIDPNAWKPYLKPGVSMINSVLLLPFFLSFFFPVAEQLGLRRILSGNEKMNFPHEYFCFSPAMTSAYGEIARGLVYEPRLGNQLKEDVCRELYLEHPRLAQYQYSCWKNRGERWCYGCESCLEYYALLKNLGLNPALVGLDENRIRQNRRRLVSAVSRAAESRPGELWERMCDYPNLRRDPFMKGLLDEIRNKARTYHAVKNLYDALPDGVKYLYREQKSLLKRLSAAAEARHALAA